MAKVTAAVAVLIEGFGIEIHRSDGTDVRLTLLEVRLASELVRREMERGKPAEIPHHLLTYDGTEGRTVNGHHVLKPVESYAELQQLDVKAIADGSIVWAGPPLDDPNPGRFYQLQNKQWLPLASTADR